MCKQCNLSIRNHTCRLGEIQGTWEFIPLCAQSAPHLYFLTRFLFMTLLPEGRDSLHLLVKTLQAPRTQEKNLLGMNTAPEWVAERKPWSLLQFHLGQRLRLLRALCNSANTHSTCGNGLGWVLLCSATFGMCLKRDRLQWGAHPAPGSCWSSGYGIPGACSWWQQWLSAPWKGRKWPTLNNKFSLVPFAIFTTHFRINERLTQKKVLQVHAQ